MALIGILLVAVNLRTAAVAISPIVDSIDADIPLDSVGIGVIGAIPSIAFSLSAIFGAVAAKKFGLERLLVFSIIAMTFGHVLRAVSGSYAVLLIGTIVSLAAAGIGNVLLPPLVKRYFPDRIGLLTGLYALLLAVSAALPAALAAPVASAAGWQVSIGMWAGLALLAFFPWAAVLLQHRSQQPGFDGETPELVVPKAAMVGKIWHSRMAWTLAVVFALSSAHFYTAAAWFPEMIIDLAGVSPVEAGGLLAAFSLMGVPAALLVPMLAVRMKNISWLVLAGIGLFILGYLGLLFAPTFSPLLWAMIIGLGNLTFPVSLVLINLRSRTHDGSVALSGFVQGVGYALAAGVPLVVGLLHDVTAGWTVPLALLLALSIACIAAAIALRKPNYIEDDLARVRS